MVTSHLFVNLAYAWQLSQGVLNRFLPSSRIPQFILDTQHPWINDNKYRLRRLEDPQAALCSLNSSLRPGRGDVPEDLFAKLEIDNNKAGIDRPGWNNAEARLQEILKCPAALQDVQEFKVGIWIHHSDPSSMLLYEAETPSPKLVTLFVESLQSMSNLTSLDWETFGSGNKAFRTGFAAADLQLHTVTHLKAAKDMECLVSMCPNIEKLEIRSSRPRGSSYIEDFDMKFIESAKHAKNLTQFHMSGDWAMDHFEAALRTMPNITTLEIGGFGFYRWGDYDQTAGVGFRKYLDFLTLFKKLTDLRLPAVFDLGIGFSGGSGCGNAYFGAGGRAYGRQVMRQSAKATEEAAGMVFPVLPNLEALSFGRRCVNLTRGEDGRLNATWPWTGRLTEWTYEIYPE